MPFSILPLQVPLGVEGQAYIALVDATTEVLGVYIIRDGVWFVGYVRPDSRELGVTAAFLAYCDAHLGGWPPSTQFVPIASRAYAEHIGLEFTETDSPPPDFVARQTGIFDSLGRSLLEQAQQIVDDGDPND